MVTLTRAHEGDIRAHLVKLNGTERKDRATVSSFVTRDIKCQTKRRLVNSIKFLNFSVRFRSIYISNLHRCVNSHDGTKLCVSKLYT